MNINEAIEKYKRIAGEYTYVHDIDGCLEVMQLVEWLRTARGAEKAGRYFTHDIHELKQKLEDSERDNAKLREDNACLVKAIDELHSVSLEDRLVTLENENDRLRELVRDLKVAPCCMGACWMHLTDRMRELGIEVGE